METELRMKRQTERTDNSRKYAREEDRKMKKTGECIKIEEDVNTRI